MANKDEVFAGLRTGSCPADDQEAAERVSEAINMDEEQVAERASVDVATTDEGAAKRVGMVGKVSLEGLIRCVFYSVEQFRKALGEYGWNLEKPSVICENSFVRTSKAKAIGRDGAEYLFILNEIDGRGCEVVNCRLVTAGTEADPDELAAYKRVVAYRQVAAVAGKRT